MDSAPRPRIGRFVVAVLVAAAFVLSAPFIGQLRSGIKSTFPAQFVAIVGGLVAVMVIAALAAALLRIRDRRALRYALLAAALAGAVSYSWWHATGRADVDVVELFHFVEYGVLTLLFYRAWRPLDDGSIFILPVLAGLLVGTFDEWLQWFIPARVGEIRDVLLNGVAIGCGLLFSLGVDPPPRRSAALRPGSLARLGRWTAAVIVVLALFLHVVHLGYVIADPETGSFTSRYSKETLERLDAEKRDAWRVRPLPLTLHRVSREDQYMTEGVVHVQERNEQWAAGHGLAAWCENRILEKYFASVASAPSYVSRTGHRWSAEQRDQAAAHAAAESGGSQTALPSLSCVSEAYPYTIYPWSKPIFWGIVTALSLAILIGTRGR